MPARRQLQLAPLLPRFIAAHPKVSLDVTFNDRVVDLVDEGHDLAIRITRQMDPQLIGRRLASTRMVLCVAPRYLAIHGTPSRLSELAGRQILAPVSMDRSSNCIWTATICMSPDAVRVPVASRRRRWRLVDSGDDGLSR